MAIPLLTCVVLLSVHAAAQYGQQGGDDGCASPYSPASACRTLEELQEWHQSKIDQIHEWVPAAFQKFSTKDYEPAYKQRLAELKKESLSSSKGVKPVAQMLDDASAGSTMPPVQAMQTAQVAYPSSAEVSKGAKPVAQMLDDASAGSRMPPVQATQTAQVAHPSSAEVSNGVKPVAQMLDDASAGFRKPPVQATQRAQVAHPLSGKAAQPSSAKILQRFLDGADTCDNEKELKTWHAAIIDFVQQRVPAEVKPFAVDDVERRFNLRLARIRTAARKNAAKHEAVGQAEDLAQVSDASGGSALASWMSVLAGLLLLSSIVFLRVPLQSHSKQATQMIKQVVTQVRTRMQPYLGDNSELGCNLVSYEMHTEDDPLAKFVHV